jgi:hypothetical protein
MPSVKSILIDRQMWKIVKRINKKYDYFYIERQFPWTTYSELIRPLIIQIYDEGRLKPERLLPSLQ